MNTLQALDYAIRAFVEESEHMSQILFGGLRSMRNAWQHRSRIEEQVMQLGSSAGWVMLLAGLFIGLVLAMEWGTKLEQFGAKLLMGRIVAIGVIREIGPVLAGIMIAARTGSMVAAELGSMKVTDQIDALRALGADPIEYLVMPRQVASVLTLLPLTLFCDLMGVIGGWVIAVTLLNTSSSFYWDSALDTLLFKDLAVGFIKPIFFGWIIASISAHYGLYTSGGAAGVGKSATRAVVASTLTVLATDFVLGKLILTLWG
jgi:phospholipid/cholesterol/gamma-HCH transport system permease protein